MADKERSRRDYLTLKAVDPVDGKKCEILVSHSRMQAVGRRSMAHAKEYGLILPMILQKPTAIFEGKMRTKIAKAMDGDAIAAFLNLPIIPMDRIARPFRTRFTLFS